MGKLDLDEKQRQTMSATVFCLSDTRKGERRKLMDLCFLIPYRSEGEDKNFSKRLLTLDIIQYIIK